MRWKKKWFSVAMNVENVHEKHDSKAKN
jgi:hypothetical protein